MEEAVREPRGRPTLSTRRCRGVQYPGVGSNGRRNQQHRGRLVAQLLTNFVIASVALGVLAGGLAIPVAAAMGGGVQAGTALLSGTVQALNPTLPQTSVM